jgi:apolipoprotein N-acyltransferase
MANPMQLASDICPSQKLMELEDAEESVKEICLHGVRRWKKESKRYVNTISCLRKKESKEYSVIC